MMSSPASWRRLASMWIDQAAEPRPATRSTSGAKCMTGTPRSVTGGRAGRAARVVDAEEAMAGADRDQLDRAPGGLLDRMVAAFGEFGEHRRGKSASLVKQRVGQPLLVKARRRDRLVRREAEIDDPGQGFEHRGDDARASRAAENEDGPAVLFDDCRGHRGQRPFARRDRVRLALDQPELIGRTWPCRVIAHLVVEQKAGAV